jgi:hypothetical protein
LFTSNLRRLGACVVRCVERVLVARVAGGSSASVLDLALGPAAALPRGRVLRDDDVPVNKTSSSELSSTTICFVVRLARWGRVLGGGAAALAVVLDASDMALPARLLRTLRGGTSLWVTWVRLRRRAADGKIMSSPSLSSSCSAI